MVKHKGIRSTLGNGEQSFNEKKEKLLEQTQSFKYSQSKSCSAIGRQMALGMLGTTWTILITQSHSYSMNNLLFVSQILVVAFLLCDVLQYFLDTISYHFEISRFDDYKINDDLDKKHEKFMDKVYKRSFSFFMVKNILLLIAALVFIIGIWVLLKNSH